MKKLLLALPIIVILFGAVFLADWPWWLGLSVVLAMAGLAAACLFLRRLVLRRKERVSVRQAIEEDEQMERSQAQAASVRHDELQLRWKEAMRTLRRSHLRRQGNPLYVLPWYLMIGETGCGKTTAIAGARSATPFAVAERAMDLTATGNCDWWFLDQAIVMDTAGRYAMPLDPAKDGAEWQKFVSLLARGRKREPLNGVIVAISAERLLEVSSEILERHGLQLRRRLDELTRSLGVIFPVYLLVTKCDRLQGMTRFGGLLAENLLDQPMGVMNLDLCRDVCGFVQGAMGVLAERLKDLRLQMLQRHGASLPPDALLFPEEFAALAQPLETMTKALLQENRYQETPLFRGLYFSSGRREGAALSSSAGREGMAAEKEALPATNRALFLHDFFEKVLPGDRRRPVATSRAAQWGMITRNVGASSWIVIWIAVSGLMSYSFVKNMSAMRTASGVSAHAPQLKGEFLGDIAALDRYRRHILTLEEQNRSWFVPRFGLRESLEVERRLKAMYCALFQERFLAPFDKAMNQAISGFTGATSDESAAEYAVHLTRRINLLKSRPGKEGEGLHAKPLPSWLLNGSARAEETEEAGKLAGAYLDYLVWRGDGREISGEAATLQALLKQVIAVKGAGLRWLPEWVNRHGNVPAITLQTFWGGSRTGADEAMVPAACTSKGREAVVALEKELRSAHPDPALLDRERESFETRYRGDCYAAWERFAAVFPKGEARLAGAREWRAVAELMPTDRGPYFSFMQRAAAELAPFGAQQSMPPLLQRIVQLPLIMGGGAVAGMIPKSTGKGSNATAKVGELIGRAAPASGFEAAAKAGVEYRNALLAIAPATRSREQAYRLAHQVFSEDPAVSKSPFYLALDASERLKREVSGVTAEDSFARLVSGPLAFLWSFAQKEAACAIQTQWEEQVLREAQGAHDPQMLQYLVAQEGPVWKFVNGSLGTFHGWSPGKGYYSKAALGGSVAFQPAFFTFLARGTRAKVALARTPAPGKVTPVTVTGLPTDANADAKVRPHRTRLELQCASGPQVIENLNYPVSKTFAWGGDTCGDVSFQIDIGDLTLSRHYPGFPVFLRDFRGGRHTFRPKDFPGEKEALERMGVRLITANYQFSGAAEVTSQGGGYKDGAETSLGEIPRTITRCWE